MKKNIVSFLTALAMAALVCLAPAAQASAAQITSEVIVTPQYEDAGSFSDGYAAVKKDGKWGYIDEEGNVVVDFQYDWADSFSEGVAVVAKLESVTMRHGVDQDVYVLYLIDEAGEETKLMDPYFDPYNPDPSTKKEGPQYYSDLANLENDGSNLWGCKDGVVMASGQPYTKDGTPILPTNADEISEFAAMADRYGDYSYFYQIGPARDGVIPMRAGWAGMGGVMTHCFYMDVTGKITKVFPVDLEHEYPGIANVWAPNDGLILARYYESFEDTGHWGVLDMDGNWVAEPVYTDYFAFFDGTFYCDGLLSLCDENGKWGALDAEGNTVVEFQYNWITTYTDGYAAAQKADGTCVFLDTQGNEYRIGTLDGGVADHITICSNFNASGLAAVYDADTGVAYCVSIKAIDGVFPAVENSQSLGREIYFPGYDGEGTPSVIRNPSEIVTIEENGLYGYARLDVELVINPFSDVSKEHWFYDTVLWAVDKGITTGVTDTTFEPDSTCTRNQVVTFLWRAAGQPEPASTKNPFADVKESDYFYKAVLWAVEKGITTGVDATHFDPDGACTRAQVVAFLYRSANKPAPASESNPFTDVKKNENSEWYYEAVLWAVGDEITTGVTETTFEPESTCTRAQIVTFLYRNENN